MGPEKIVDPQKGNITKELIHLVLKLKCVKNVLVTREPKNINQISLLLLVRFKQNEKKMEADK